MTRARDRIRRPAVAALAAATACALLAATPRDAFAQWDWSLFAPHSIENHAWFETFASWENDDSHGISPNSTWNDAFIREKLTLSTEGYSYDPRFLRYRLSLGGAVKQERYDSSVLGSTGWDIGEGLEYDARVTLLPDHPYNLLTFATRYEPVYPQQAAASHNNVADDYGVSLRYRRKPWFFDAGFLDSQMNTTGSNSDVQRVLVDGEYFKRWESGRQLTFNGSVHPSWYTDSNGLDGSSLESLVGNVIDLKKATLSSNFSDNTFDQKQDNQNSYDTKQLAWWELFSLYLPWNFRTDLEWRMHDDTSDIANPGPITLPDRHYSDDGNSARFDVVNRLYESVDTTYRFLRDVHDTSGGNSTELSNGVDVQYTKQVPHGRVLVGGSFERSDFDNHGMTDVVADPYTGTAVPGTFTLRRTDVDPSSIVVLLRSPIPPFETIQLVEGVHYFVNTLVEPFEVQILSLPVEFVVPGSYDFYLSYSQSTGEYELQTDDGTGSASVELFNQLVTPYFRYTAVRSSVLSGVYPGTPIDSDSYSTGVRLLYGPVRARGEYQRLEWASNPYDAWRAELQYVGPITRTITTYTTATFLDRHFLGGEAPYTTPRYYERIITVSGTITKQLFSRNLVLAIGGSYSNISGLTDSNAWSANSSIIWHIGKLDLSLTATAYGSDSHTGVVSTAPPSSLPESFRRDHELISINIKRQLL
ncbi:MAG TPA: hypothetical protein VGK20_17280 [Candidatus Binatia bacterium]|jgi:hypothetical protein